MKSVQMRSFLWSVFSCIWSEYGDLLHKPPISVQIQENTDHKKLCIWTIFTQCHQVYLKQLLFLFSGQFVTFLVLNQILDFMYEPSWSRRIFCEILKITHQNNLKQNLYLSFLNQILSFSIKSKSWRTLINFMLY